MASRQIIDFRNNLLEAENILATLYSFDLAEPNYQKCLQIIYDNPDLIQLFEEVIINLLVEKKISSEPIAYLMYYLKWKGIKIWIENQLNNDNLSLDICTMYNKIYYAYELSDEWENKFFYKLCPAQTSKLKP